MSTFESDSDGAKMSFKDDMSYIDYLSLDLILDAQNPRSDAHDEMLFSIKPLNFGCVCVCMS